MTKLMGVAGVIVAGLALTACGSVGMRRAALVEPDPVCQDVTAPVYFGPNQASLTREGRRVIAAAAAGARGCRIDAVRVVGLADAAGDPAANLELSRRRTAAVAAELARAKLPPAEFDLTSAGDAGAIRRDGALQPVRRRADITLKLTKPK